MNGLTHDIDAVRNAILYEYNNGRAEGCVNKIKRMKHSMYGRASFLTLRTKVLLEQKKNQNVIDKGLIDKGLIDGGARLKHRGLSTMLKKGTKNQALP